MVFTEAEARQLEVLANSMLRLIADWREQRKKNESAADAYHAGYRAAQEAMEASRQEEPPHVYRPDCPCRACCSEATERLARERWTGMRAQDLRRKRDEALEAARIMTEELDGIRRGSYRDARACAPSKSGLSPEEAMRE